MEQYNYKSPGKEVEHYENLTLSPKTIYNYFNYPIGFECKKVKVSCLIITTREERGQFEQDIKVEFVITKKEKDSMRDFIESDRHNVFDKKLNIRDPYFYRFKKQISTGKTFLPGNFVSIIITTNDFAEGKYFVKDVNLKFIDLCWTMDKPLLSVVSSPKKENDKFVLKKPLEINKNLLSEIVSYFDISDIYEIVNVSKKFRQASGVPKV